VHTRSHTGEKPFECNICAKRFSQSSDLNWHYKVHTGEKFKCDVCSKEFTQKSSLSVHQKIHIGEKKFTCNICDKSFIRKFQLESHLKVHTGDKPYKCQECDKCFSDKYHLYKHRVVHTGEKPFSCDMCGKSYTERGTLNRHKTKCKGPTLSQQGVWMMQDPRINFYLNREPDTVNNLNLEPYDPLKIEEIKMEPFYEEDNVIVDLPKQEKVNQISDTMKNETYESHNATRAYNPYLCVQCWKSFSIESDFINHKTTCQGNTSSLQNQVTASTSHNLQFVDCGETIKEEIKEEESEDEFELDPSQFVKSEFSEDFVKNGEISS